jgi:hypothetical protein
MRSTENGVSVWSGHWELLARHAKPKTILAESARLSKNIDSKFGQCGIMFPVASALAHKLSHSLGRSFGQNEIQLSINPPDGCQGICNQIGVIQINESVGHLRMGIPETNKFIHRSGQQHRFALGKLVSAARPGKQIVQNFG